MDKNEQIIDDDFSLDVYIKKGKEWISYMLSKWKIIFLAGLVGASIGLFLSIAKKPVYTANLNFVVEDEKSGGMGAAFSLANQFLDIGGGGGSVFSGSNLIEFFKSRKMVEKTLLSPIKIDGKTISLAELYIQSQEWRDKWDNEPNFKNIQFLPGANRKSFSRVQDSILGKIYDDIMKGSLMVVQKDKKIAIISISMSSTNELFSKIFTENIVDQVSEFYIDTKSKKARLNMEVLSHQIDSIRGELNASITGVAIDNDNTFALNPSLNVRRAPSARKQVDVQANSVILTELVKQSELAKAALRKEMPLVQVIDSPILPLKKEKLGKAKGIILGGFFAGFLTILGLLFTKIIKNSLENN